MTAYEVEPDMAGETVILLWGLFDDEMFAEFDGDKRGSYFPLSVPVPLHRYRAFKLGKAAVRADSIQALAQPLNLPISAQSGSDLNWLPTGTKTHWWCHISRLDLPRLNWARLRNGPRLMKPDNNLTTFGRPVALS